LQHRLRNGERAIVPLTDCSPHHSENVSTADCRLRHRGLPPLRSCVFHVARAFALDLARRRFRCAHRRCPRWGRTGCHAI